MLPETRFEPRAAASAMPGPATPGRALFVALALALGGLAAAPVPLAAQTHSATPAALADTGAALQLLPGQRAEVEQALRAMPPDMLYLTFARIHAAFRIRIGDDDLRVARALIDYARLAEAELAARGLSRPASTESARDMLLLYELVL